MFPTQTNLVPEATPPVPLRQTVPLQSLEPVFIEAGSRYISFLSNDYLGLSRHPAVISRASAELQQHGLSSCSSRVVGGTTATHLELEAALARYFSVESTLLFSSGYLANLAAMTAAAGRHDLIILDRLCHASLYDGAALSGANMLRYTHNDLTHLQTILKEVRSLRSSTGAVVVTESVFSMDGDRAPLHEIATLCQKYDATLLIDEAHSVTPTTVMDLQHADIDLLLTITLSKSFGGVGGAIGCTAEMRQQLVNSSRQFIFDTASTPHVAAGLLETLRLLTEKQVDTAELISKATKFRDALNAAGFNTLTSTTQIVPLLVGDERLVVEFRERLKARGILAAAIRSPSVAKGTERLRFSVTLGHSDELLAESVLIIETVARDLGILR